MNKRACSFEVPFGILNTANKNWTNSNPDVCFGYTYMDFDPKTWALQQLGLGYTKAITEHISTCDEKIQDPTSTSIYKSPNETNEFVLYP